MRVVFSTPTWVISGVNSFTLNLIRGLQRRGYDAELLVVRQGEADSIELPFPADIPVKFLEFDRTQTWWLSRWEALRDYLQGQTPTVYFPNYDFENGAVASALANDVGVIGVIHSDDPHHYEHLERMGRYWNAVISVSSLLHKTTLQLDGSLADRAFHISYGVPHEAALSTSHKRGQETLRILFSGRFYEEQKRVSDLPKIAEALEQQGIPARWTLIGTGPQEGQLRAAFAPLVAANKAEFLGQMSNDDVLEQYDGHDCLILTSAYEGLPVALLEAMSRGCIPVVTDIRSGIPDVIENGRNGFTVPIGDVLAFATRFAELQKARDLRRALSQAAFQTIASGGFGIDTVVDRYAEVIEFVRRNIVSGSFIRPKPHRPNGWTGDFIPPASLQVSPDAYYSLKWQSDRQAEEIDGLKKRLNSFSRSEPKRGLMQKILRFR